MGSLLWYSFIFIVSVGWWVWKRQKRWGDCSRNKSGLPLAPIAPAEVPILGHSLKYKDNPAEYIVETRKKLGDIFRINLAGLKVTLVAGNREYMKQFALAKESVLSSREAVVSFGFEKALGALNVWEGTDCHKYIAKSELWPRVTSGEAYRHVIALTNDSLSELNLFPLDQNASDECSGEIKDTIFTIRRVVTSVIIKYLVGSRILELYPSFVDEFVEFQDSLEDGIAKSNVLPHVISDPLILGPIEKHRNRIVDKLSSHIDTAVRESRQNRKKEDDRKNGLGIWVQSLLKMEIGSSIGEKSCPPHSRHIATIICSTLFAAAKNPALGCAQTLLDILDPDTCSESLRDQVQVEAEKQIRSSSKKEDNILERCTLETLRLSSHSIGAVRKVLPPSGFRLGDYWVPPSTYIACSHISPHLEPVWGSDYHTWNPNRPDLSSADDFKYTAFSHGTHRCPGRGFALVLIQGIISVLLTKYDMKVTHLTPYNYERATLAQRDGPCSIEYRLHSSS